MGMPAAFNRSPYSKSSPRMKIFRGKPSFSAAEFRHTGKPPGVIIHVTHLVEEPNAVVFSHVYIFADLLQKTPIIQPGTALIEVGHVLHVEHLPADNQFGGTVGQEGVQSLKHLRINENIIIHEDVII